MTKVFNIDPNLLYVTVFEGDKEDGTLFDSEAYSLWKNHLPEDRILKYGKKDNFGKWVVKAHVAHVQRFILI